MKDTPFHSTWSRSKMHLQVLGGMRGMTGLLCATSLLDPEEGIWFRGLSIPECQKLLPAASPGGEPLPEGFLWLLLTGKVPGKEQVDSLSAELRTRAQSQVQSEFQKAYEKGIHKSKFWEPTYEDCLSLIAQVPVVAACVYQRMYKNGQMIPVDDSLDYGGNFAQMLGFDSPQMLELMQLYVTIHSYQEGGNVSAHTGHLVKFLEYKLSVSLLLHLWSSFELMLKKIKGVLLWIKKVDECGEDISTEQLKDYVWNIKQWQQIWASGCCLSSINVFRPGVA